MNLSEFVLSLTILRSRVGVSSKSRAKPPEFRITRVDTGKHVIVRINDRGPFVKRRIIVVSRQAAELLGMIDLGVTRVKLQAVEEEIVAITHVAPPNSIDIVDAASP